MEEVNDSGLLRIADEFLSDIVKLKPLTYPTRNQTKVADRISKVVLNASLKHRYGNILHTCVRHYDSLVKILSEAREYIDINRLDPLSMDTALHKARFYTSSFIYLLNHTDINVHIKNPEGYTAFTLAMFSSQTTNTMKHVIIEYIKTKDDEDKTMLNDMLNARNKMYGTVLYYLEDTEIMKYLIKEGIDVHVPCQYGICLLSIRLITRYLRIDGKKIKHIGRLHATPSAVLLYNETCFQTAYNQVLKQQLKHPFDVSLSTRKKLKFLKKWYKKKLVLIHLLSFFSTRELQGLSFLPVDLIRKLATEFFKPDYYYK